MTRQFKTSQDRYHQTHVAQEYLTFNTCQRIAPFARLLIHRCLLLQSFNPLLLLHLVENGACELVRRGIAAHVSCPALAIGDNVVDSLGNAVRVVVESNVPQHHGCRQQQRRWVSLILALDIETDVSAARLEHSDVTANVAARHDTGAADQTSADVGENATVQVWHDHDVELLRAADALHRCVVDDHVVRLECGVLLRDLLERVSEETIGQLHDVRLVDASDLLAVVCQRECERELGDAL